MLAKKLIGTLAALAATAARPPARLVRRQLHRNGHRDARPPPALHVQVPQPDRDDRAGPEPPHPHGSSEGTEHRAGRPAALSQAASAAGTKPPPRPRRAVAATPRTAAATETQIAAWKPS